VEEDGWGCRLQFCRLLRQYVHRFIIYSV
jgi:hypothetical protein